MQQKELAILLDISPAMVSRLAKRGMPTDTLERAERWRRRHLEPGRVKGARFDRAETLKAASPTPAPPASPPRPVAYVPDADLEAVSDLVNGALTRGDQAGRPPGSCNFASCYPMPHPVPVPAWRCACGWRCWTT